MTVMEKREAHIEYLVNRNADAIHKKNKCDRTSGIGQIPGGYLNRPITTIARPL